MPPAPLAPAVKEVPATEAPLAETGAPPAPSPETASQKDAAQSAQDTTLEAAAVKAGENPPIEAVPGAPAEATAQAVGVTGEAVASEAPAPEEPKKKRRSFFG